MKKTRSESYSDFMNRIIPGIKSIKSVTFQVTEECNLRCTYCYQTHKMPNRMTIDVAKKFIDMLLNTETDKNSYISLDNTGGVVLDFIGGEPLLEIDLIDDILEYWIEQVTIKQHPWATRWRASMCSNGVLYFDEEFQKFLNKYSNSLSFTISIDGNKRLHDACRIFPDGRGSYDIALAGVQHYMKYRNPNVGSKMTLAPENIQYTAEAVIGLIESNYTEINLNCVFENVWEQKHSTILYYQLKELADYMLEKKIIESHRISIFDENFFKSNDDANDNNWCGGTGAMIAVDWKGDIYPCLRYMPSSLGNSQPPIVIGNVDRGIVTTSEEKKCVECMKCITRTSQSTEECNKCPIGKGCAWCSAYNYQEFGTINKRATYICEMHKARALANIYFWNKYYLSLNMQDVFYNNIPDEWALKIIPEDELNMLKNLCKR